MPHSSSGFGEIRVNRVYLVEEENVKEDLEGKLTLTGQESSPPASVALVTFLHGQVSAMQKGNITPVTFRDKSERDGYYTVTNANSELKDFQSEVATADWTLDLTRGGSHTEVDIQSRLTGAVRQNDYGLTGERWHAPAINHYSYHTGATDVSSWVDRTSADGTIRAYRGIPTNAHPKWGCTPTNFYLGRARITDTLEVSAENEIEGINRQLSTTGWSLSNGLVNVTGTASPGIIDVQSYSGGSYHSTLWNIQRNSLNVQAWQSVTILRNSFEQCVIRLTANIVNAPGRVTLDLSLRRGSRFVECYLQSSSSTTLGAVQVVSAAAQSGTGWVVNTSNDANGNRPIIGASRTVTYNIVSGGLSKAASTALDFYIGAVINGSSPANGDAAAALQDQYIGTLPESTYLVRR